MMSTFSQQSTSYFPCSPDQFAVFKRGDKALCLVDIGNSDWLLSPPPKKGQVYVVRDFHWGNAATLAGAVHYGQIINLEGVLCDRVPRVRNVEYGWHHANFRKVTEQEAQEIARAGQTQEAGASI